MKPEILSSYSCTTLLKSSNNKNKGKYRFEKNIIELHNYIMYYLLKLNKKYLNFKYNYIFIKINKKIRKNIFFIIKHKIINKKN